ncbi:MAG: Ku protein [Gemmatimonadales bacterium]
MSVHVVGSATISFGLVSVPVKLYSSADSSSTIAFNWLNKNTGARVKQQYVDAQSGEKVDKADMIKGYEFSKGQYVTFTPDDLKALDQKATNSIDIEEFIPLDKVDRIFLAKAYFLGPDKGGARAYHLLSEALTETGRAALGQYSSRGKQYLVLVRPMNGVLVMEQLHYVTALRQAGEIPIEHVDLKDNELELAKQLIEQSSADDFSPEAYHDTVYDRVMEAIQGKVEGEDITAEPTEEPQAKIIDLMAALKASLAEGKKAKPKAEKSKEAKSGKKRAAS